MFHETMTPGERTMSLLQTGWADRPGVGTFAFGFAARMTPGMTLGEVYSNPLKYAKAYIRVQQALGFDTGPTFGSASQGASEFGGVVEYPGPDSRSQAPSVRVHPLSTPDKVDALFVPDPAKVPEITREVEAARYVLENYPQGFNSPTIVCGSPFTWAGNAIGVETMLLWMIREPELAHKVLKAQAEFLGETAKYIINNAGPMMLFDGGPTESNDLISPKQFEQFALPYMLSTRKAALGAGIPGFLCHPCGDQNGNIKMWAQAPGNAGVNFDFRTPLEKIVEIFGPTGLVVGNIEPAKFQYSNYDWIYNEVTRCMNIAALHSPHGYIVGPGCEIPTDTPPLHVGAMLQATRDFAQTKEWQERRPR
jgi:uroporphyrinogen decarboxylase